jgi:4-amino-4-deoxy-L-arabinose transferase-like glycosyltransferase
MMQTSRPKVGLNEATLLILLALVNFVMHVLLNDRYGFHRDELPLLEDARHLAWGYVAYPPVTPFLMRVSLELFGTSLVGVRMLAAVAASLVIVLAGLMARELGGSRFAQIGAAVAVAIAPMVIHMGGRLDYVGFDLLWWVSTAYFMIRLLKSDNPRWWLAIGAVIGLGLMTKYTMSFFVAGIVGGVLLTGARRFLTSRWQWAGAALALLIVLPNLIWQAQHDFVSLDFLNSIHDRDIEIGRTEDFFPEQLIVGANIFTLPFWVAGLYFYFFKAEGKRYRPLGWMYVIPLVLFIITQGRSYYLAPAYPMLVVAGVVTWGRWLAARPAWQAHVLQGITWASLAAGGVIFGALLLPVASINSDLWDTASDIHDNFVEQIGWPELAQTVAEIYNTLPAEEQARTGILTANYGEAGAINLYGPAHGLPPAISGVNSYWLRGYGDPPPETVIVLGYSNSSYLTIHLFKTCELAGRVTNPYGVENEETGHPNIYVCRGLRKPWDELWQDMQHFG